MLSRSLVAALLATLALSSLAEAQEPASPEPYGPAYGNRSTIPSLQYNYYSDGGGTFMPPARMYLCPRPVPERVGYTFIPYGPLAPHHFLWQHQRVYFTPHPNGLTTVTRVTWR